MEFLFNILVEALLELFGEGFISLYSAFVPHKVLTDKTKNIIRYVSLAISLILFAGLFVGVFIVIENNGHSFWGWLLISLSIAYFVAGITLKIISHIKK